MKRVLATALIDDKYIVSLMNTAASRVTLPNGYYVECDISYDASSFGLKGEMRIVTESEDIAGILQFDIVDSYGDYLPIFSDSADAISIIASQFKSFVSSLGTLSDHIGDPEIQEISLTEGPKKANSIDSMTQDELEDHIYDLLSNISQSSKDAKHFSTFGIENMLDEFENVLSYADALRSALDSWKANF